MNSEVYKLLSAKTIELIEIFKERHPLLSHINIEEVIIETINCYKKGGKVLTCGNGGSAADSLHIVGELMKGFVKKRSLNETLVAKLAEAYPKDYEYLVGNLQMPLTAISLVNEVSLITAYANDKASDLSFAQQVLGHGNKEDILIAISTSGNSKNVIYAAKLAKVMGLKVISLTGKNGGELEVYSDYILKAPSCETYQIQEYHLPIYHILCLCVENELF